VTPNADAHRKTPGAYARLRNHLRHQARRREFLATLKCARFTSVPPNGVTLYGGSPLISYQCISRSSISVPISR